MRKFGGSWSESKLDCVEQYAQTYLQVMQKQGWCEELHYVDAFAGRGRQTLKTEADPESSVTELDSFFGDESERADTEEFLVGSAIRAVSGTNLSRKHERNENTKTTKSERRNYIIISIFVHSCFRDSMISLLVRSYPGLARWRLRASKTNPA